MKAFARSTALVLCGLLASCARNTEVPAPICPAVVGVDTAATFVSPPKGATGVPATIGSVSFTVSLGQLHQGIFTLSVMGVDTPGQKVTVAAYQTDASGKATVAIPVLTSHVTYAGSVSSADACRGTVGGLGSFTVQ